MPLKLIFMTSAIFFVSTGHASSWRQISATSESAESPAGIFKVLEKYGTLFDNYRIEVTSALLAGLSPNKITKIAIESKVLNWVGPTLCKPDDSRLQFIEAEAEVITDTGVGKVFRLPSEEDPCIGLIKST